MADFQKQPSISVKLDESIFTGEEGVVSGVSISSYRGNVSLTFWKKGEQSSKDQNNTISLSGTYGLLVREVMKNIINSRQAAYEKGEAYIKYPETVIDVKIRTINGRQSIGKLIFDSIELNGVERIRLTLNKNDNVKSVVFYDDLLVESYVDQNIPLSTDIGDYTMKRFVELFKSVSKNPMLYASISKLNSINFRVRGNAGGSGRHGGGQSYGGDQGGGNYHQNNGGRSPNNGDGQFNSGSGNDGLAF